MYQTLPRNEAYLIEESYIPQYKDEIETVVETCIDITDKIDIYDKDNRKAAYFQEVFLGKTVIKNFYLFFAPVLDRFFAKHNIFDIDGTEYEKRKRNLEIAIIVSICEHFKHIDNLAYLDVRKTYDIHVLDKKYPVEFQEFVDKNKDKYGLKKEDVVYKLFDNLSRGLGSYGDEFYPLYNQMQQYVLTARFDRMYLFLESIYSLSEGNISRMVEILVELYDKTRFNGYKFDTESFVLCLSRIGVFDFSDVGIDSVEEAVSVLRAFVVEGDNETANQERDFDAVDMSKSLAMEHISIADINEMPTKFVIDLFVFSFLVNIEVLPSCGLDCRSDFCEFFTAIYFCPSCENWMLSTQENNDKNFDKYTMYEAYTEKILTL